MYVLNAKMTAMSEHLYTRQNCYTHGQRCTPSSKQEPETVADNFHPSVKSFPNRCTTLPHRKQRALMADQEEASPANETHGQCHPNRTLSVHH